MIQFTRDATLEEVKDAYAKSKDSGGSPPDPEVHYGEVQGTLAPIRKSYRGGAMARDILLVRKIGETDDQYGNRVNNWQNVPLLRIITSFKTRLLYVVQPERHLCYEQPGDVNGEQYSVDRAESRVLDDAFDAIYKVNRAATLFSKQIAPRTHRDLMSWVKVFHDEVQDVVRMASLKREQVVPVMSPDDSDTALGIVELQPVGDKFRRILWTESVYGEIDGNWKWVNGGPKENPIPGEIPYICFGMNLPDMGNPLDDAVFDQKHLVNLRSQVAMGIRSQTFTQLWSQGRIKGQGKQVKPPEGDGNERVMMSPEYLLQMDSDGSLNALNPDYPVTEVLEAERQELKRALETYNVSAFSVDPSSAPEQPMSLAVKMLPSMWARAEDVAMFEDAERSLGRMVAIYGAAHDHLPCTVEDVQSGAVEVEIRFAETVLPSDKAVKRAADAADVAGNRELWEDYYKEHIKPGADDAEVAEDKILLGEQAAARAALTASTMGGIVPARPGFPLAGATPGAGSNGNGQNAASALLNRLGGDGRNLEYTSGGSSGGTSPAAPPSGPGPTPGSGGGGRRVPFSG